VQNWFSGETMTFRRTSAESGGGVEVDLELRPLRVPAGAPHRHIVTERFEFTAGAVCA
jgi:hypothetical protein